MIARDLAISPPTASAAMKKVQSPMAQKSLFNALEDFEVSKRAASGHGEAEVSIAVFTAHVMPSRCLFTNH
jgi:hypothetical protein